LLFTDDHVQLQAALPNSFRIVHTVCSKQSVLNVLSFDLWVWVD